MKPQRLKNNPTLLAVFGLVLGCSPALAFLGGTQESIATDFRHWPNPQQKTEARAHYQVVSVTTPRASIREYVSETGKIFAISWQGKTHPNLVPLLGNYSADYLDSLSKTKKLHGRRYRAIRGQQVVVEKWGHERNMNGRAYVANLFPTGITLNEIN